jgi:hypothetical protein
MDETYRMLGKEHEADLEREAQKWRRAAEARGKRRAAVPVPRVDAWWRIGRLSPARLVAFLVPRRARLRATGSAPATSATAWTTTTTTPSPQLRRGDAGGDRDAL